MGVDYRLQKLKGFMVCFKAWSVRGLVYTLSIIKWYKIE